MANNTETLLTQIFNKNFVEAKSSLNSLLFSRINDRLNDEKVRLSNTMFNQVGTDNEDI
jgi:hypothetical protein